MDKGIDLTDRRLDRGDTPVYKEIMGRLRRNEVGPQDRLVDTAIAAELNVSRMPVREALLRLVHEGYLVGTTRGFMLPQLSSRDFVEIFQVRKLIEPRAAAHAAEVIDAFGVAALETAYASAVEAVKNKDFLGLMEANTRFRQTWLEAVPNRRLAGTISRFVDHVQAVRNETLHDLGTQEIVMNLLTELMTGFRNREIINVHDSMARFIDRAQERFFALTQEAASRETGAERKFGA